MVRVHHDTVCSHGLATDHTLFHPDDKRPDSSDDSDGSAGQHGQGQGVVIDLVANHEHRQHLQHSQDHPAHHPQQQQQQQQHHHHHQRIVVVNEDSQPVVIVNLDGSEAATVRIEQQPEEDGDGEGDDSGRPLEEEPPAPTTVVIDAGGNTTPVDADTRRKAVNPFVQFWNKCKGVPGAQSPPLVPLIHVPLSGLLAFIGILAIAGPLNLEAQDDVFMLLGSFGATAVLLYGAPEGPLSQPRNVIGGHMVSAFCGAAIWQFGEAVGAGMWLTAPLSVAIAIMFMQLTKTLHPPGGATSLLAVVGSPEIHRIGFQYIITPAGVGACIMVFVAVVGHNLTGVRNYPKYWW